MKTLQHGQPCGCAIGNLIAGNNNFQIIKSVGSNWKFNDGKKQMSANWVEVHSYGEMLTQCNSEKYHMGIQELLSIGYDTSETCSIEAAFESSCIDEEGEYNDDGVDEDGYIGLMKVVDTLMLIHEATIEEATEAKQLFVLSN